LSALPLSLDSTGAKGYRFGSEQYCEGVGQYTKENWNRLVFVHNGSVYAKLAITAKQDTLWGSGIPSYQYIKTVTLRYLINSSNDLSGLITPLQRASKSQIGSRFGARVEQELYNALGVRLRRDAGRFEPAFPAPRKP
jgi:hypothetical protein